LEESFEFDRIRALIAGHLDVDIKLVTNEAHFTDDLGADWLDRLELMMLIEDQFTELKISDHDVDQIEIVGDLIRQLSMDEECDGSMGRHRGVVAVDEPTVVRAAHLPALLAKNIAIHNELADLGVHRSISRSCSAAPSPLSLSNARRQIQELLLPGINLNQHGSSPGSAGEAAKV
jgi:acyl carrier protein